MAVQQNKRSEALIDDGGEYSTRNITPNDIFFQIKTFRNFKIQRSKVYVDSHRKPRTKCLVDKQT